MMHERRSNPTLGLYTRPPSHREGTVSGTHQMPLISQQHQVRCALCCSLPSLQLSRESVQATR